MLVILTAIGAAIAFAASQICVRRGLSHAPPMTAVTISIITMTTFVWLTLGPSIPKNDFSYTAVLLFMVSGTFSPLATQILLYSSATRLGISRASPLRNTTPLFASLLAIAVLGERWTLSIASGTFFIVLGAILIGMRESGKVHGFRRVYLLLPLGAAMLGGIGSPMRKFALSLIPSVPVATTAVMTGAMMGLLVYLAISGTYKEVVIDRSALLWFGLGGLFSSVGIGGNVAALKMGSVVVVSPLIATVPLWIVMLTAVFLRAYEQVTVKVALGATSICLGGILLTVF
ncbi:MAG: EamA family transporter [Candidatus Binatia bacterium]